MNEKEILLHLQSEIQKTRGELYSAVNVGQVASLFGIGQKILAAVKLLVGQVGLDVNVVVAAAKAYYDEWTKGDNPSLPNSVEDVIEKWVFSIIEVGIRQLIPPLYT